MHYNYIDADQLRISDAVAGMPAVVFFEKWYRVDVIYVSNKDVMISFTDYGHVNWFKVDQLRYLKKSFSTISRKCVKASLFGLVPANGDKIWPIKTMNVFKEMTKVARTFAIVKAHQSSAYSLALFDDDLQENFKNFLLQNGLADISDEAEECKNGILVSLTILLHRNI